VDNKYTPKRSYFDKRPIIGVIVIVLIFFVVYTNRSPPTSEVVVQRYLFQSHYLKYETVNRYKIAVISDLDKKSILENKKEWNAIYKLGELTRASDGTYSLEWQNENNIKSGYNEAGRGMELSELVKFNNKLLSCDDRTGIVFEISEDYRAFPLYVLTMGNGRKEKGLKCEWMTVVDDKLYVGSIGKEFTVDGKIEHLDSMWVKIIDREGRIQHVDWTDNYNKLRKVANREYPAYLLHEAVNWDPAKRKWVFMPRRSSSDPYSEELDEEKGTNIVLYASLDFSEITMTTVGELDLLLGISSFKFIPFREDEILYLKTVEHKDRIQTYVGVVNLTTKEILMPDTLVDSTKFEGIEFL